MQPTSVTDGKDNAEESTSDWGEEVALTRFNSKQINKMDHSFIKIDLNIDAELEKELELSEKTSFNIFKIRDMTNGNELVTVILSILFRENIFAELPKLNYIKLKTFLLGI